MIFFESERTIRKRFQPSGQSAHRGGADWQTPGWCLSYRGKVWEERVVHAKKMIDDGVTGFWFDDYSFSNCFGPKTKKTFKEFLIKFTDLPYKDPVDFMRTN